MLIFIIISILLFLFIIIIHIRCKITNSKLKDIFKNHSTIVFGAKGKGKDLLFQKVIYLKKDIPYLSNCNYGYKFNDVALKELSVKPNEYDNFIANKIEKITKNEFFEGKDYFLSDAGVYLPSQYDFLLHKNYPSLPIFYALSRHLYDMNIHMNTQNLTRPWKALREQADYYIFCNGKIKLLFGMICKIRFYDNYDSAYNKLLPVSSRLLNGFSKAEVDQFYATHGIVKNAIYYIRYKDIKYDTRIFHFKLFGYYFNKPKKKVKRS